MRIAIDMAAAINQRAGIGRYARGILGAIAAMDRRDWVMGIAPRPNANAYEGALPRFAHGRTMTLPIAERQLWILWQRLRLPLPPDLLARGIDVVYNPDFLLPRLAHAPGVCTVHDLGFMTVPECSFPKLRAHLLRAVPWSLARARLIIAVSEHTKRDLVRLLGVEPGRIRVAGNAADPLFRSIADASWRLAERRRLALPGRFLLTVGTLEPRKNVMRLLDALAILRDRGEDIALVVAGREGWLYEPIYERVDQLQLRAHVTFLRDAGDADLLALYNLADVMVYPSLYEGFGVPPLEALACGTPVVCSRVSSLPEVAGDAALLVDPYHAEDIANAVERALHDTALRDDLMRRGPLQAARYTWHDAGSRVLAALREAAR